MSKAPGASGNAVPAESTAPQTWGMAALVQSRLMRRARQARLAAARQGWIDRNRYYYDGIARVLRFVIEPGKRVLNVRCQTGGFLEAVSPSRGVGVEISPELVAIAQQRHPQLTFICSNPEELTPEETFDYVLFSDVSDTVDVLTAFRRLAPACEPQTRMVVYHYNSLWQPIITLANRLGLRMEPLEPNWLSERDIRILLRLAGFQPLQTYRAVLVPKRIPVVSEFFNRIIARLPLVNRLCMASVIVARPTPKPLAEDSVSVSIVVPCRNERGNIEAAVQRIPEMGRHTEIIFCDDKSTDGTADEVRRVQLENPDRDIRLLDGPGICKAQNVWTGFRAARGDVLVILDADLTVMPEELPGFVRALSEGQGEFINGSRLVYPVPKHAMKVANVLGNKGFSLLFSYLLDHPVKDTLCGTKVLWRRDWQRIEPLIGSWGVEDRWGDYELLFGAAKLQLAIVDMPVHYQERIYGVTKMTKVFWNGWIMLRMCLAAGLKLKGGY